MHGKKKKLVNFEDIIIETIRNERQIEKTKEKEKSVSELCENFK